MEGARLRRQQRLRLTQDFRNGLEKRTPARKGGGLCGKSRQFGRLLHQYEYLFINPLEQGKMKWAGAVDAPALVVSA